MQAVGESASFDAWIVRGGHRKNSKRWKEENEQRPFHWVSLARKGVMVKNKFGYWRGFALQPMRNSPTYHSPWVGHRVETVVWQPTAEFRWHIKRGSFTPLRIGFQQPQECAKAG